MGVSHFSSRSLELQCNTAGMMVIYLLDLNRMECHLSHDDAF